MHFDELINATLRGRNYAEFNRDAGRPVSDSRMRDLAKPDTKWAEFLEPETMLGVSVAGGVTYDETVRAASKSIARWKGNPSLAMRQEESQMMALMPAGTDSLTDRQTDSALRVIGEYIAANAALAAARAAVHHPAEPGAEDPAPPSRRRARKT